jgi:hypothetical protein
MNSFFDLFTVCSRPEKWMDPGWADRLFPDVARASPMRLWRPGDPISPKGTRLLVGIATWCGYDMRLLDVMAEAMGCDSGQKHLVELFNTADCRASGDFKEYVPGLHDVLQTPVVGCWQDGNPVWTAQGYQARDRVAHMFNTSSDEIVAYVDNWIKSRSFTGKR